jgi:hypothetical protein
MRMTKRSLFSLRLHAWTLCAALALSAGCHDSTAPSDAALSGRWVQYGIDSYAQLDLQKRGTSVTGTYQFSGIGGPSTPFAVTGTATAWRLLLQWREGDHQISFDVTLPLADPGKLTGRMSFDGRPPGEPTTFVRPMTM